MPRSEPVFTPPAEAAGGQPIPPLADLVPANRGASWARRRRKTLIVSALLHVAALVLLLLLPKPRPAEISAPPGLDIVFEPGAKAPTQVPGPEPLPSAPLAAPTPPSREPPQATTPTPPAQPAPQQPPAPPLPPEPPVPPAPTTTPQPQALSAPPEPAEAPPPPPPTPEAAEPVPLAPPLPTPPRPPREASSRPTPKPAHPRPTTPSTPGAFPRPTFSAFGNVLGGALEGSRTTKRAGGPNAQLFHQTAGAPVGDAWEEQFREWVETHKYYPEQAAQLGQEGLVAIEIRIAADGRITALRLQQTSGSPWLDLGLQAMFRGAQVPALPPGPTSSGVTFEIDMTYRLIR